MVLPQHYAPMPSRHLEPARLWTIRCPAAGPVGHNADMAKRFIALAELAEILDISAAQAYALVRSGELPAIKVGGRGQWRVETSVLEDYIARMYAETADFVRSQASTRD